MGRAVGCENQNLNGKVVVPVGPSSKRKLFSSFLNYISVLIPIQTDSAPDSFVCEKRCGGLPTYARRRRRRRRSLLRFDSILAAAVGQFVAEIFMRRVPP